MCQPKWWNKIIVGEVEFPEEDRISLQIIAERSDLELFNIRVELHNEVEKCQDAAYKFKKVIEALESYRDCDCSIRAGQCVKHFTNIQLEGLGLASYQAQVQMGGV